MVFASWLFRSFIRIVYRAMKLERFQHNLDCNTIIVVFIYSFYGFMALLVFNTQQMCLNFIFVWIEFNRDSKIETTLKYGSTQGLLVMKEWMGQQS